MARAVPIQLDHDSDVEDVEEERMSHDDADVPRETASHEEYESDVGHMWERVSRWALYGMLLLTPIFFLPWTVQPAGVNKQFFVIALVLVSFLAYLVRALTTAKLAFPRSILSLAVLAVLVTFGLGTIFSNVKTLSFFGNFIQPDTMFNFIAFALAFFLAAVFLDEWHYVRAFSFFMFGAAFSAVVGLLHVFGVIPWNMFGSFLAWGIFIGAAFVSAIAALSFFSLSGRAKIFLGVLAFLFGVTLFLLGYQIIWIGVVFVMIVFMGFRFMESKSFGVGSGLSLPMLVMMAALLLLLVGNLLPTIVGIPAEPRPNFSTTLEVVKSSFRGTNAVFGSGPGTFGYQYELFKPTAINQTGFWQARFSQGSSFLITALATTGALGLAALFFLIGAFVLQLFKSHEHQGISMVVFSGTFFLLFMWFFSPLNFTLALFAFLGLGVLARLGGGVRVVGLEALRRAFGLASVIGINILVVVSLGLLYIFGQRYVAALYYSKGVTMFNAGEDRARVLVLLDRARRLDVYSDQYLRAFSQALLARAQGLAGEIGDAEGDAEGDAVSLLQAELRNTVSGAINIARAATVRGPHDSLNWSNLGAVYENLISLVGGIDALVEESYKRAVELNPKNPQPLVNWARSLTYGASGSDALDTVQVALEEAIALKGDYAPAYYNLGLVHFQKQEFDDARTRLEQAVIAQPQYGDARYFLGLVYNQLDLREEAIQQFEIVASFNPDNQNVQDILEQLGSPVARPATPPPAEDGEVMEEEEGEATEEDGEAMTEDGEEAVVGTGDETVEEGEE